MSAAPLGNLLVDAAARRGDHPAIEDERGRCWTYAELDHAADRVATWLAGRGVGRGDRVGLFLPKSLEGVAAVHGILRAGAAYVPTDPTAPAGRAAGILADAGVKAVVVASRLLEALRGAWPADPTSSRIPGTDEGQMGPAALVVGDLVAAMGPGDMPWDALLDDGTPTPDFPPNGPDDLAYVLYTSGSTGRPKGVMLSHGNAACFLDWCSATLGPRPDDRFSSHAPFHFDLSIFDLFASCGAGGTLVLIGEALGKEPARLGAFLAEKAVTVWYSAPSILALLTEYGAVDRAGFPAPRLVLFAGEVFPIRPLKRLRAAWPDATLWNLYGPTETNVCTAEPIPATIPGDRDRPFPIGRVCPPLRARVVDEHGADAPPGDEGELVIAGPGVMRGYLGQPELTSGAFLAGDDGTRWYRTGDRVVDDGTGIYLFRGRRDRMVKRRGCRIELGEIEAALARHDQVERAAVIARGDEDGVTIAAFVALRPGAKGSTIAMKRHCAAHLPAYMAPDTFTFLAELPSTSTDKIDYQALASRPEGPG